MEKNNKQWAIYRQLVDDLELQRCLNSIQIVINHTANVTIEMVLEYNRE